MKIRTRLTPWRGHVSLDPPVRVIHLCYLVPRELRDLAVMVGRSIDGAVVTDNHLAIVSRVNVKFDGRCSDREGVFNREECRRRTFERSALVRESDDAPREPGVHFAGSPYGYSLSRMRCSK